MFAGVFLVVVIEGRLVFAGVFFVIEHSWVFLEFFFVVIEYSWVFAGVFFCCH